MASINDKLCYVGSPGSVTSLAAPGKALAAASINIGSGTNWPTASAVYFTIRVVNPSAVSTTNPSGLVSGTQTFWKGTLSGTTISNLQLQYGTDQVYTAGTNTQVFVAVDAFRENSIVDWGLAEHTQLGTHGNITATGYTQTTGTHSIPAGSLSPAGLTGGNANMLAAYASWTPTFTNLSGGTLNYAKYVQVGKQVTFYLKYTLAGAGVAGAVTFTTPTAMSSNMTGVSESIQGSVSLFDTGTSDNIGQMKWASSTTISIQVMDASFNYVRLQTTSATIPHVWGATDVISISGTYEAP